MKEKAAIFWSGGKDSAFALFKAREQFDIKFLITTFTRVSGRVTMHGLQEELIDQQAKALGIPMLKMWLEDPRNEAYEELFLSTLRGLKEQVIENVIFGDIFLEDLKAYRDKLLAKAGMQGVYPLWKKDTAELLKEIFAAGFKTLICAASLKYFSEKECGSDLGEVLSAESKTGIDPCGENGEYHTFCWIGPIFKSPVKFEIGETIKRSLPAGEGRTEDFWFTEINSVGWN